MHRWSERTVRRERGQRTLGKQNALRDRYDVDNGVNVLSSQHLLGSTFTAELYGQTQNRVNTERTQRELRNLLAITDL